MKPRTELRTVVGMTQLKAPPFLKWVGGKSRLQQALQYRLPKNYRELRHVEPFLGGGALFFAMAPDFALLSDSNPDLINAYLQIRDNVDVVLEHLTWLQAENCEAAYYEVRELFNTEARGASDLSKPDFKRAVPTGTPLRAAVFLYLNKTCFRGLYRENKDGDFNVPWGDYKNPDIMNVDAIRRCAALLWPPTVFANPLVSLRCADFRYICGQVSEGDFIYLDPPYVPASETANFTSYTAEGFDEEAQSSLAIYVEGMHKRGAKILLSNHDTPLVRELYKDFHIEAIEEDRSIAAEAGAETKKAAAVLVRNYDDVSMGVVDV